VIAIKARVVRAEPVTVPATAAQQSGHGCVDCEQTRAAVDPSHSWLRKLATAKLGDGLVGSCVTTTLGNLDRLGIPRASQAALQTTPTTHAGPWCR